MLGRAVIATGNPAKLDAVIAYVREQVQPVVDALPGSRGVGMWVNRDTGQVVVSTAWEDVASLHASDVVLSPMRREALQVLGAPDARIEVLEPTILVQLEPTAPGAWMRASEIRHPRDRLAANLAEFSSFVLPEIRKIPGVGTIVMLVDRASGLTVLNVTYNSREAFDASRAHAEKLRASSVASFGAEFVAVTELEVVIVGIRAPVHVLAQAQPLDTPSRADQKR